MRADTKLTVVMCCHIFDQRYTAPSSSDYRRLPRGPRPVDLTSSASQRASSLLTCLCIFLSQNKIIKFKVFFIILKSIYFKEIETTVFYQKNMYKLFRPNFFMFLDLKVTIEKLVEQIVMALETVKECGQFHIFWYFQQYVFEGLPQLC